MYNRLTLPKAMCLELEKVGVTPILIDNNSTYKPLLEFYENDCPYKVHRLDKNWGHQCYWIAGINELYDDEYFLLTDHDLDISSLPSDWADVLKKGLDLFPNVIKSGLSLKIDDLPENEYTKEVISWESKYWERELNNGFYMSEIDTTLAMYDKDREFGKLPSDRFFSAVRSDKPYSANHLPWYNTTELSEEEKYYLEHTGTYWAEKFKELI